MGREGLILVGTLIAIALPFTIGFDRAEGVHGLAMLGIAVLVTLPLFTARSRSSPRRNPSSIQKPGSI